MNRPEQRGVRTSVAAWWRYAVRKAPVHLCGCVTAWRDGPNEAARLSDSRSTGTPTHRPHPRVKDPFFSVPADSGRNGRIEG